MGNTWSVRIGLEPVYIPSWLVTCQGFIFPVRTFLVILTQNPQIIAGYTDPNPSKSQLPRLHEWHFRSGLDRYIWIIGMIYAYYHPIVERWMEKLEETEAKRRISIKTAVGLTSLMVFFMINKILFPKCSSLIQTVPLDF
jgi:hypothetical protein